MEAQERSEGAVVDQLILHTGEHCESIRVLRERVRQLEFDMMLLALSVLVLCYLISRIAKVTNGN